jgi:hypothetical protein
MILVYWTTTTTTERQIDVTVEELLDAISKSGQEAPARETDQEYVERVMDEVDMDTVLPHLESMASVEINSEDVERTFDDWGSDE